MAGLQGTARVVHYAATKAYLRVLAEGLWAELRPEGVAVLACVAGPTRTPAFLRSRPRGPKWLVGDAMEPEAVAEQTLRALGSQPVVVPGRMNRLTVHVTQRLLPRRLAVALNSAATRAMYPE